jgi:YrbI family 3-deoxy-D-manno-octulosonate 8-phosphate phosphatase
LNDSENTCDDVALSRLIRNIKLVAFDFDGVFTDNAVYVMQDGSEAVRCFRGDGLGLRKLERAGIRAIIISTETNPVVGARSRKLGIHCVQSCEDKRLALESICKEMGIGLDRVAYVGNDINDLECLASVGLPIVVHDAHPDVTVHARFRTERPGGQGAVREICDLFDKAMRGR